MPTDPYIFATTDVKLHREDVRELSLDLSPQLGVQHLADRFTDHNALFLIPHKDYVFCPTISPNRKPSFRLIQAQPTMAQGMPAAIGLHWLPSLNFCAIG